jgi:hypothetical protein
MPVTINGTTGVIGPDGSASTPSYQGSDSNTGMFFPAADTIAFSTAGTEDMRIDSAGNVGIGTSSPQTRLDVVSPDASNYDQTISGGRSSNFAGSLLFKNSYWSAGAYGAAAIRGLDSGSSGGILAFYTTTNGGGTTGVPTERARIDSSGNLLVGTTSNTSGARIFADVTSAQNCVAAYSSSTGMTHFLASTTSGNTGGADAFAAYDTSGIAARITSNGFYQSRPNSYGGTSDLKLKENVVDATPKLADLMAVQIRNYNYKDEPGIKQIGVIAQELEQVFPGLVYETSDRDAEGNDLGTTTKSVKYSVFVPMLIKAVQELTARVQALESQA